MTEPVRRAGAAQRLGDLSALWRGISLRNRFHLSILGLSALALVAALAMLSRNGRTLTESLPVAANAAVMLFLAWALAREIDPDFPGSAFVAAAFGGIFLLAGSAPAGVAVALLAALRIVTRSTGRAPTGLDLAALPVLAVVVALTPRGWIAGVAVAAALAWDTRLPEPASRRNLAGALATITAGFVPALLGDNLAVGFQTPDPLAWAAVGGGVLGFLLMRHYAPRSFTDRGKSKLSPERLRAGRRLAAGFGMGAFALFGGAAVPLLAGLWGALIGVALHRGRTASRPSDR